MCLESRLTVSICLDQGMMQPHLTKRVVMKSFVETGTFNTAFVATIDAKIAAWHSLLPVTKRDPMRRDGSVDEVMFLAHLMIAM